MPNITLPAFTDPRAWAVVVSIALIAIATIPESTAHLYQMSLYIDALAKELERAPDRDQEADRPEPGRRRRRRYRRRVCWAAAPAPTTARTTA
ncbi:MAG: hypothetical protein M0C28_43995 [Candidatus Moduliflexus flocculans]|nr:hypothetical protein [Candidatus Moduliflexus flocculans]